MENNPISPSITPLSQVVKTLMLQQGTPSLELENLLKQGIQTLSLRLIEQLPTGVRLQLPSGQSLIAQGSLPYPVGSELVCKMEAQASGIKLQTLEAKPPATPAFLAPLNKSEAQSLLGRLTPFFEPPPARTQIPQGPSGQVSSPSSQPPAPQPTHQGAPTPQPTPAHTARPDGPSLPDPSTPPPPSKESTPNLPPNAPKAPLASDRPPASKALPESDLLQALPKLTAQQLQAAPELVKTLQHAPLEALAKLFVFLKTQDTETAQPAPVPTTPPSPSKPLEKQGIPNAPAVKSSEAPVAPPSPQAKEAPSAPAPRPDLLAPKGGPDVPTLTSFLKGATQTLANPALSPEEAPFHALQAKEGTAYFEIPMPWVSASPLQWWVEADSENPQGSQAEPGRRMLLSLHFSGLGDTRVGFQYTSGQLAIRIWTEHPEPLLQRQSELEAELQEYNPKTTVSILPLGQGEPLDVRALIKGGQSSDWRAMA